MVLWRVCVPGKHRVLPGSPMPHCRGKGERRHRDFAVMNPSIALQAKKLATAHLNCPSTPPKVSLPLLAGPEEKKKENQLSSKHLVAAAALCLCWCCTPPCPSAAMQGALSHWAGYRAAPFLSCTKGCTGWHCPAASRVAAEAAASLFGQINSFLPRKKKIGFSGNCIEG